jgi:hypothetical protein
MREIHELTLEEYNLLKATGMMFEFYPDATGTYSKDVYYSYDKLLKCFFENMWDGWEVDYKDALRDPIGKNEFVKLFFDSDKITSKIAREMLNITDFDGDYWESKKISIAVKRLNRLK